MPLPDHVLSGTRHPVRGFFGRMRGRLMPQPVPGTIDVPSVREPAAAPTGPDAATRAFWARGEAPAARVTPSPQDRVAALLRSHERGVDANARRPRGNPAFSEALFVELMRAKQYRRAFEHLSAECRSRWGSADSFAAAQGSAMRRLQGVAVKDVRYLDEWVDPDSGVTYRDVAELDAEYTLVAGEHRRVLPRVVHLVPDDGKWRSLCYPA